MNHTTEELIQVIESDYEMYQSVQTHKELAVIASNANEAFSKWLKEWLGGLLPQADDQISIFIRNEIVEAIDFDAIADYFLDEGEADE